MSARRRANVYEADIIKETNTGFVERFSFPDRNGAHRAAEES